MIVVLMGVSGSGKTTIGTLLAQRIGTFFIDADDFHPAANKMKMAAGHPLDDADRQPWLAALNRMLIGRFTSGEDGVLACSALKTTYRETLAAGMPPSTVTYVLLDGSPHMIAQRLAERHHEYMNPHLLQSQLLTLEPLRASEQGFRVVNELEPDAIVDGILEHLHRLPAAEVQNKA